MLIKQVNLFYTDEKSDKVYNLYLKAEGDLFVVNYANGKRGSALKHGTRTTNPVDLEAAKKKFASIVKGKVKDGYTEHEHGQTFTSSEFDGQRSSVEPQLLNTVDEAQLENLINDDNYIMQRKFDGERRPVIIDPTITTGVNKKGLRVPLSNTIETAVIAVMERAGIDSITLDGEDLGTSFAVFDIIGADGDNYLDLSVDQRIGYMQMLLGDENTTGIENLIVTPIARTTQEKRDMVAKGKEELWEGVVLKDKNSKYEAGRPASGGTQLKFKFYSEASVIVTGINDKRSVKIALLDDHGELVPVGNVTIPANKEIPSINSIIETRYLYSLKPSNSLFQPTFKSPRNDVDRDECRLTQLVYKAVA